MLQQKKLALVQDVEIFIITAFRLSAQPRGVVSVNCVSRITTNSVTDISAPHDTALSNIDPGDVLPEVEWTIETPREPHVDDDVIQDGKHSLNIAR